MPTWKSSPELLEENSRYIPGGLASLNRKTDLPIAFARAHGSRMWDLEGREYIDYHAGFAPYILGHNDLDVNRAVKNAIDSGLSNYGTGPTEQEGELAKLFLRSVKWAERVQFLNTGSEATAQAIRVARAATGKSHVILVQGSYNGHHNTVATNLMSTREQLGGKRVIGDEYPLVPITAGIPREEQSLMHAVEFNDLAAVEVVARRYPIACMITEPVLQNIGVVEPGPGYLRGLRDLADRYGFLLIFDEVKTGFRAGLGGYAPICGVMPDLATYGKAVANGYPISALAGKRQYMDLVLSADPSKRVLLAGTYNAHPVPVAAATACLKKLADPAIDAYGNLERLAERLESGQREIFEKQAVPMVMSRVGSAHCVYFAEQRPTCWWDILVSHDFALDTAYRRALIERGVYNFPMACKQGSISLAHTASDIDETLAALDAVLPRFATATTA